jgi:hypothetical protein
LLSGIESQYNQGILSLVDMSGKLSLLKLP